MIEIATKEFKIPKTLSPVVCHTTAGETIAGDIFLDVIGQCSPSHIHDFFEADALFFPVRTTETEKPFLIAKEVLVLVEIISSRSRLQSDTSILLCEKKPAVLDVQGLRSVTCEIVIDTPADRSRILDVLNHAGHFLSIVWNNTPSLVNKRHILRVVEL
jgi:hypothetical protein